MRYLTDTHAQITSINEAEAQARGCSGTTTEWYGKRETASGDCCLLVDDDALDVQGNATMDVEPEWPPESEA